MLPIIFLLLEDETDRQFMENLYAQYHRLMYAQALEVLRQSQAAEDAVSESLLALIKKISLLRTFDSARLRSYVVVTVKHLSITLLNKRQREKIDSGVALEDLADAGRVDDRLLEEAGVERIRQAIRALPPREKDIMLMKYFREMTDEEIAEEIGVRPVSVRVHLSRARKHLAQLLLERGECA